MARLEELCRLCPEQHSALNWGHDYGEGILLRHESPWDELDIESDIELRPEWYFDGDPLEIPELTKILYAVQLDRPKRMKRDFKQIHETVANLFTGLPHEILGYIIPYLPTDDVKALSRTCKGLQIYIPSELETSFWISRFQPPFEFDFFFEVHKYKGKLDWKSLYFEVAKTRSESTVIEVRKCIWDIIRSPLSDLPSLHKNSGRTLRPPNKDKLIRWKEVHGYLRERKGIRLRSLLEGASDFTHNVLLYQPSVKLLSLLFLSGIQAILLDFVLFPIKGWRLA